MQKLSLKLYQTGGCPFCGGGLLSGGECEPEHNYVFREFTCDNCHQSWIETYRCVEISSTNQEQSIEVPEN